MRLGVHPRETGQTATFGKYEWIYNPNGLTSATWEQIRELARNGEGPIRVIEWPDGKVIFNSGEKQK